MSDNASRKKHEALVMDPEKNKRDRVGAALKAYRHHLREHMKMAKHFCQRNSKLAGRGESYTKADLNEHQSDLAKMINAVTREALRKNKGGRVKPPNVALVSDQLRQYMLDLADAANLSASTTNLMFVADDAHDETNKYEGNVMITFPVLMSLFSAAYRRNYTEVEFSGDVTGKILGENDPFLKCFGPGTNTLFLVNDRQEPQGGDTFNLKDIDRNQKGVYNVFNRSSKLSLLQSLIENGDVTETSCSYTDASGRRVNARRCKVIKNGSHLKVSSAFSTKYLGEITDAQREEIAANAAEFTRLTGSKK